MHGCNGSTNEGPNPKDPLVILGLFIVVDDNNFQIRGIAFSTSHQKIPLKARAFLFLRPRNSFGINAQPHASMLHLEHVFILTNIQMEPTDYFCKW